MENLKQLKKHILENIDENWTDLEKVRYVYVESGKHLQKYTEFFLTLEDKLNETALSPKKLDKTILNRKNRNNWNKMICKSGAEFIKDVLNDLKIPSQLVETVRYEKRKGMKNHLHHYFLCVTVEEGNIFLTPAADYVNIQNGFCTLRFGTEISYLLNGEPFYKSNNGEIPHITLPRKRIKELDDKLGFSMKVVRDDKEYTTYIDEEMKKNKNLYVDFLARETLFYNRILPEDGDNKEITSLKDPDNDWTDILSKICIYVGVRVSQITGISFDYQKYINKDNFEEWCNYVDTMIDEDRYDIKNVYYSNPVLIYNKAKKLCKLIIDFVKEEEKKHNLKDDYIEFRTKFNRCLTDLSKHFINKEYVIEPKDRDKYISNTYINHKISTFFPYMFNANSGFKEDFNYEGYSEQIECVKRMLEFMFSELGEKNLIKEKDPDFKLHPLFKRINLYSVKNRKKDEYAVYFAIADDNENNMTSTYWYKYDLAQNDFTNTSPAIIARECSKNSEYEIISNRLKSLFEDLEGESGMVLKKKHD